MAAEEDRTAFQPLSPFFQIEICRVKMTGSSPDLLLDRAISSQMRARTYPMQIETITVVKVGGAPILAIQPHLHIPSDDLLPELLTVHRPESDGTRLLYVNIKRKSKSKRNGGRKKKLQKRQVVPK